MLKDKLSPLEQEIYFTLVKSESKLFTVELIKSFEFGDYGTLRETLSNMARKGWLIRIKRGTYYVNTPENSGIDDLFRISSIVFNGYLAFSAALYIYKATTERPYTIYVATRLTSKTKMIGSSEIRAVALKKRAIGMINYNGYCISSKAKTLYDCFYMPDYAGGYSKILEAVYRLDLKEGEWEDFVGYMNKFETDSFKRRVGYLLDLSKKAGINVPSELVRSLNLKGSLIKLGSGRKGKYIKKWGIVDYLGEEYLLSWSR